MGEYTEEDIERDVADRGLTAPRVARECLDELVVAEGYHVFPGTTVTVCALTLQNGYAVVGHSAAASPENFDQEIGRKIARADARDKIWALEGYLLRQRLHESQDQAPHRVLSPAEQQEALERDQPLFPAEETETGQ